MKFALMKFALAEDPLYTVTETLGDFVRFLNDTIISMVIKKK